jgi:hypothetical protein
MKSATASTSNLAFRESRLKSVRFMDEAWNISNIHDALKLTNM